MGGEGFLRLENPRIAVEIDRQTGALRSIRDKEQNVIYPQAGIGFEVVTTEGIFRSEKVSGVNAKVGQVELRFAGNGLDVILHYQLGVEDRFVEKWLESSRAAPSISWLGRNSLGTSAAGRSSPRTSAANISLA